MAVTTSGLSALQVDLGLAPRAQLIIQYTGSKGKARRLLPACLPPARAATAAGLLFLLLLTHRAAAAAASCSPRGSEQHIPSTLPLRSEATQPFCTPKSELIAVLHSQV